MKKAFFMEDPEVEKIPLEQPYEIECIVDGIPLKALVIAEMNYPIDYAFAVKFSDGFEGVFVETFDGWWIEDKAWGKKYADAIKRPLKDFLFSRIRANTAQSSR